MVTVAYDPSFRKKFEKLRDPLLREKVKKQIQKIVESPEIGKPMRYSRKGSREVYVPPLRLSYKYLRDADTLIFLDLYHKDEQ